MKKTEATITLVIKRRLADLGNLPEFLQDLDILGVPFTLTLDDGQGKLRTFTDSESWLAAHNPSETD